MLLLMLVLTTSEYNPCDYNDNDGCSFHCDFIKSGHSHCSCPSRAYLKEDGKNCQCENGYKMVGDGEDAACDGV